MITPQRATELAVFAKENRLCEEDLDDVATIIEAYARMMSSSLPESLAEIISDHARRQADLEALTLRKDEGALSYFEHGPHRRVAVLLDAVRGFLADQTRATEIIDERIAEAEKWHAKWKIASADLISCNVEIERLNNRADHLAEQNKAARAEVQRYQQRDISFTHPVDDEAKLQPPLACPNCSRRDPWAEFLGDSGFMRCGKEAGGCGYSLSLDPNDPENLRAARDISRAEVERLNKEAGTLDRRLRLAETEASSRLTQTLVTSDRHAAEKTRVDRLTQGIQAYRARSARLDRSAAELDEADAWEASQVVAHD